MVGIFLILHFVNKITAYGALDIYLRFKRRCNLLYFIQNQLMHFFQTHFHVHILKH
jgi:hypothetical protein